MHSSKQRKLTLKTWSYVWSYLEGSLAVVTSEARLVVYLVVSSELFYPIDFLFTYFTLLCSACKWCHCLFKWRVQILTWYGRLKGSNTLSLLGFFPSKFGVLLRTFTAQMSRNGDQLIMFICLHLGFKKLKTKNNNNNYYLLAVFIMASLMIWKIGGSLWRLWATLATHMW